MKRGFRQLGVLMCLATALLALEFAPPASAQDKLPTDIYNAESLSPEQTSQIQAYVSQWAPVLINAEGTGEQIVTARQRLLQPLGFVSTDAFRQAYTQAAAQQIPPALDAESLLPRLNAMIILSRLEMNEEILSLIRRGMQDPNPAVRYWAIKGIRGSAAALPVAAQRQLLQDLTQMLENEQSEQVLEQTYHAMVELNLPGNQAITRVLEALNQRVAAHVGRPELTYRAEYSGTRTLYQRLLTMQASQGGMDQAFAQLARAAVRYMDLIARQGRQFGEQLPPETLDSYLRMVELAFQVLSDVHRQTGSTAPVPASLRAAVASANWDEVLLAAQQFRDALTQPPFGFEPAAVAPPQGAATAGQ